MRKQTEKQFQAAVVKLAKLRGWLCYHTYDSRRSSPGFPDLVLVREGAVLFCELKSENGKVSEHQQVWLDALRKAAELIEAPARFHALRQWDGVSEIKIDVGVGVCLWRPSDWPTIEKVLK